jgi:hypothetical protein
MTGTRDRTVSFLVKAGIACIPGWLVCGYFSASGNVWEKLTIIFLLAMFASLAAAFAIAVHFTWSLRGERGKYRRRVPLSDDDFVRRLATGESLALPVVRTIRDLAAKRFRLVYGDKFYPEDRVEEDLHISDSVLWEGEDFWDDMQMFLRASADEMREFSKVRTFGDIVLVANGICSKKSAGKRTN